MGLFNFTGFNPGDNYDDYYDVFSIKNLKTPKSLSSRLWEDIKNGLLDIGTKGLNFLVWFVVVAILFLIMVLGTGCRSTKLPVEDYYRISQRFVEDSIDQSSLIQMQYYASDSFSLIRTGFTSNYRPQIINGEIVDGQYPKMLSFEKYEKGTLFEEGSGGSLLFLFDRMSTLPIQFFPKGNEYVLNSNEQIQVGEAYYKSTNKKVILLAKRHDQGEIRPATGDYYENKGGGNNTQPNQKYNQPQTGKQPPPKQKGSGVKPPGVK